MSMRHTIRVRLQPLDGAVPGRQASPGDDVYPGWPSSCAVPPGPLPARDWGRPGARSGGARAGGPGRLT
jgi:hypothetical protein